MEEVLEEIGNMEGILEETWSGGGILENMELEAVV